MNYLVNLAKTPKEMNAMMNQVLKERIQSYPIPVNSYASLGLLKADPNGKFQHYGLHPNFLLYRADKKDIEIIETSGHFIGIEVSNAFHSNSKEDHEDRSFTMNKGDILFVLQMVYLNRETKSESILVIVYTSLLKQKIRVIFLNLLKDYLIQFESLQEQRTLMMI